METMNEDASNNDKCSNVKEADTMNVPTTISTTATEATATEAAATASSINNEPNKVQNEGDDNVVVENDVLSHQMEAIIKSINFASSIACMNSNTYRNSFLQSNATNNSKNSSRAKLHETLNDNDQVHPHAHTRTDNKNDNNQDSLIPPPSPMLQPSFEDFQYNLFSNDKHGTTLNTTTNLTIEQEIQLHNFMETQTSLPKLISSIHCLQSNLYHLSSESDLDTTEVSSLHSQVQHYKSKYTKYKKFSKKLWKLNCQLKQQMEEQKEESRLLLKSMKKFYKKKKIEDRDKEERIVATQSFIHENMMKMKQKKQQQQQQQQQQLSTAGSNEDQLSNTVVGNRRRTSTQESNVSEFEDFDLDCFYFGSNSTYANNNVSTDTNQSSNTSNQLEDVTLSTPRQDYQDQYYSTVHHSSMNNMYNRNSNDEYLLHTPGSCDNISIASLTSVTSSSRSFVTDENLPTLRLETTTASSTNTCVALPSLNEHSDKDRKNEGVRLTQHAYKRHKDVPNSTGSVGREDCSNATDTSGNFQHKSKQGPLTYTLTFQVGSEVGLQFYEMDIESPLSTNVPGEKKEGNNSNDSSVRSITKSTSTTTNRQRTFSGGLGIKKKIVHEESFKASSTGAAAAAMNTSNLIGNFLSSLDYDQFQKPRQQHQKKKHPALVSTVTESKRSNNVGSNENTSVSETVHDSKKQTAILVYDFQGFDRFANVRPIPGARLIAINNMSLIDQSSNNEQWSVDKVIETISNIQNDAGTNDSNTFTLTFRNETLTKSQKEKLQHMATKNAPASEKDCILKSEDEHSYGSSGSFAGVAAGDDESDRAVHEIQSKVECKDASKSNNVFESPPRVFGKLGKKINLNRSPMKGGGRGIEKIFDKLKGNDCAVGGTVSRERGDDCQNLSVQKPVIPQGVAASAQSHKHHGMDKLFSIFNNGGQSSDERLETTETLL